MLLNWMKNQGKHKLSEEEIDRVISMAWEDRTPFEAIKAQFDISESQVISIMRRQLKSRSWKRWRERVQGRKTKHARLRLSKVSRFKSKAQKSISANRSSKPKN